VVGLGGELLPESQAFVGPRTVEAVAGLRVQTLFFGAAAVDGRGIYASTDDERPTERLASAPVHLCGWDDISTVVSDAPPPAEIVARLPSLGRLVEVAGRAG
jgi:DeoR family transcriptional regulator, fructose operon transcriptional repressor